MPVSASTVSTWSRGSSLTEETISRSQVDDVPGRLAGRDLDGHVALALEDRVPDAHLVTAGRELAGADGGLFLGAAVDRDVRPGDRVEVEQPARGGWLDRLDRLLDRFLGARVLALVLGNGNGIGNRIRIGLGDGLGLRLRLRLGLGSL